MHDKPAYDGLKQKIRKLEHDLTESRRAEETHRNFFESAPDMFVSVDAVAKNVLQCNETIAKRLGYSKKEIIDSPVFNLYHP